MAALPVVLAGPVLRRCEPTRVCVWLAASVPLRVTGQIFEAAPGPVQPVRPFLGIGQCGTVRLGARLHVALVTVEPAGDLDIFPTGRLLEYDLILEPTNDHGEIIGPPQWLSGSPEAQGTYRVGYQPFVRPTFFLPADDALNVLHGSCRKLHGDGADALAAADALLASHVRDLGERPSALFLTGDQIYADDVAEALLPVIVDLAGALLGFEESVPAPWGGVLPLRTLLAGERAMILGRIFTPDYGTDFRKSTARNHLMGFGEFCAMYLLAWHPGLWPDKLRGVGQLAAAFRALPAVRRALANLPTYMILDDHEVTDDWNLTRAWRERVDASPTGRRVVTNAVAAYWVCQGWGNDPDRFPPGFADPLTAYIASRGTNAAGYESTFYPADSDPNDPSGVDKPSMWQYVAPTVPPVVVLDARTQRGYDPRRKDGPPELLGAAALANLRGTLDRLDPAGGVLILVAPTPVFGIPDMEAFEESTVGQDFMARYAHQQGAAAIDLESWHANRTGLYRLLLTIHGSGARACVVLSGDVHYAFASAADLDVGPNGASTVHFTQFTSSALKNRTPKIMQMTVAHAAHSSPVHFEYLWLSSPDFLAAKVDVLTLEQARAAHRDTATAQARLITALRYDPARDFVVTDSNIGQLRLDSARASARARLILYGADATPCATIALPLDRFGR